MWSIIKNFPTSEIVREFLLATNRSLEYKALDYDQINVGQKTNMAIQHVDNKFLDAMPTLTAVLQKLEAKGLKFGHMQLFVTRPGNLSRWHIDGNYRHASLNIPVFNCEHGYIEWADPNYEFVQERFESEYTKNIRAPIECGDQVPTLDRIKLLATTLVNSGVWHRLDNRQCLAGHRVVFSVRFADNPTFSAASAAFNSVFTEA